MNKKGLLLLVFAIVSVLSFPVFAQGNSDAVTDTPVVSQSSEKETISHVDFVSQLKLDMNSATLKEEVSVKTFVDGDTTHFYISKDASSNGVLKARYLAINTPESTGKIEEWGKKASSFTKEKLSKAVSIIVESDDDKWNIDSTGSRTLVWVWYKESDSEDYKNLNLEILQNGLAIASSSANNRYGSFCVSALNQAKTEKLNIYSGQKDPDFFYGDAIELTLRDLRSNIEQYNGMKVAFEGVITRNSNNSVYVEDYDAQTGMYYGISVYYGYGLTGQGLEILSVGNRSRIVGTVQYYEAGETYQISGVQYKAMRPDDPSNLKLINTGNKPANQLVDADTFVNGIVEIVTDDGVQKLPYSKLAMNTTIRMENLYVDSYYTTDNEDSSSFGAMTLNCISGGVPVTVRTGVFTDSNRNLITGDLYLHKNISVTGLVDYFSGDYQIKVITQKDIIINEIGEVK